jgi:hypothetical protein
MQWFKLEIVKPTSPSTPSLTNAPNPSPSATMTMPTAKMTRHFFGEIKKQKVATGSDRKFAATKRLEPLTAVHPRIRFAILLPQKCVETPE